MGRPRLGDERLKVTVYGNEQDMAQLRRLAEKWKISQAAAARRAIKEAAEREGLG